jgi:hypothetical protein
VKITKSRRFWFVFANRFMFLFILLVLFSYCAGKGEDITTEAKAVQIEENATNELPNNEIPNSVESVSQEIPEKENSPENAFSPEDKEKVKKIDNFLRKRNSPLAGYGHIFAREGNRTGINPFLSVAIAGQESSFGKRCFAPYNAWGMLQYKRGFASWEEGIIANFNFLSYHFGQPQNAYDCPGYCVPDQPWMKNVQWFIGELEREK